MLAYQEMRELYDSYHVTDMRKAWNRVILSLLVSQAVTTDDIRRLEPADIHLREGKIRIPGSRHEGSRTLKLEAWQVLEQQEYLLTVRPAILESVKKRNITSGRKAEQPDMEKLSSRLLIIDFKLMSEDMLNVKYQFRGNAHHKYIPILLDQLV